MDNKKKLIDNTFFYGLSSYLEYFLGLVITTIIARSLGAEQYGVYSFVLWLSALGVALLSDGLGITAIRFLAESRGDGKSEQVRPLVRYLLRLFMLAAPLVSVVLLLVFWLTANETLPDQKWLAVLIIASFLPKALNIFYINVAKGIEEYSTQFYINLIVNPFNLLAVSVVAYLGGGIREFVFAYLLVSMAYALIARVLVNRRLREYPESGAAVSDQTESEQITRSIKLMTVTLFLGFIVEKQLEVFVLNFYSMPLEAGYYNAAFILGVSAIGLVPGVLGGVILPVMARAQKAGEAEQVIKYRESARYLVILTVPLICYGAGFSTEIIELVFGEEFSRSATAFAVVLLASGMTVVVHSANSVLLTRNLQHRMLHGVMYGAAINIAIDFIAIPLYGMWGALAGFVTTLIFISAYNTRLASASLNTSLEWVYYSKILLLGVITTLPFLYFKAHLYPAVSIFLGGTIYVGMFIYGLFLTGLIREQDREVLGYLGHKVPVINRFIKPVHSV